MAGAEVAQRARATRAAETERRRPPRDPAARAQKAALDWQLICSAAAACFLVSAALIHAIWTALHAREGLLAGMAFLLAALAQTALAFGILLFPSRSTYRLTIAVSIGIAAVWALSRTVGLPVGPEAGMRQPIGMPDAVATLFELLTVLVIVPLLIAPEPAAGRRRPARRRSARSEGRTYALVGALSLYTIAFTAVAVVPAVTGHGSEPTANAEAHADASAHRAGIVNDRRAHESHPEAASRSAPAVSVALTARQMSFGRRQLDMAAGQQVAVRLENLDDAPHNFSVYQDAGFEHSVFTGDMAKGHRSETYRFRSPAAGRYWFRCDAHPFMRGEISFS